MYIIITSMIVAINKPFARRDFMVNRIKTNRDCNNYGDNRQRIKEGR